MKYFWLLSLTIILSIALSLASCKNDPDSGSLQLRLNETVASQPVLYDNMIYPAAAGHTYSVITLRYYLSRIRLQAANGTAFDLTDVLYRDGRSPDSGMFLAKEIPNGTYTAVSFIFGLDSVMNVDGGLENTTENINMEWPIPGDQGYHYMKFEGKYDVFDSGIINSFNLHLGATGGNQNYFAVSLPLSALHIDGNDWLLEVTMDVNEWLQNPNTYDFEVFGPAIMMNQTAQQALSENGATVFSITTIEQLN